MLFPAGDLLRSWEQAAGVASRPVASHNQENCPPVTRNLISFFFFWPHWVFIVCFFIAARARLSLAEAGGAAHYSGLSSQGTVSETVTHELSCFEACGIFPDQGSNPWPLDLQAD